MNIINELGGLVTKQIVKQAADSFGESESGISSAIGSMVPTILGGMLNKSQDSSGFGQVFDMINKKDNAGFLDNLGGLLGGGNLAQNDPKDIGGGLMGSLFGNKVGGILDLVGSLAGVKRSSSSGLLGMIAPMVMGYLAKKVMGGGLNAGGLIDMLTGQRKNIASAMPQGIADMIDFDRGDDFLDKASDAVSGAAGTAKETASKVMDTAGDTAKAAAGAVGDVAGKTADVAASGGNMLMKIIPLLALAAIAFFGWRACGDDLTQAAGDTVDVVGDAAGAVADGVGDVAGSVADGVGDAAGAGAIASLGDFVGAAADGVENSIVNFMKSGDDLSEDTWYNFDRITFQTGSAAIDMGKSQDQIDNMVRILNAFESMEIKIGGYTDNTGSQATNMTISQNRADAVKAVLVGAGIAGGRIATEGFGPAHPVATNDTPEGRAQNRRIAVRITKK